MLSKSKYDILNCWSYIIYTDAVRVILSPFTPEMSETFVFQNTKRMDKWRYAYACHVKCEANVKKIQLYTSLKWISILNMYFLYWKITNRIQKPQSPRKYILLWYWFDEIYKMCGCVLWKDMDKTFLISPQQWHPRISHISNMCAYEPVPVRNFIGKLRSHWNNFIFHDSSKNRIQSMDTISALKKTKKTMIFNFLYDFSHKSLAGCERELWCSIDWIEFKQHIIGYLLQLARFMITIGSESHIKGIICFAFFCLFKWQ